MTGDPIRRARGPQGRGSGWARNRDRLLEALGRARRRAGSALPASPEWDAARSEVEELERELDTEGHGAEVHHPVPTVHGSTALFPFGPTNLPDDSTIQGTIAGRPDRAESMHATVTRLADRAGTGQEFIRELERLAGQGGFVVERDLAVWAPLTFYAWDLEGRSAD